MRGGPRARRASSPPPSGSSATPRVPAARATILGGSSPAMKSKWCRGRARRALDLTPHLVGEDQRQRRLSETGSPRQQHVIEALLALARGLDGDLEALDGVPLADVLVEAPRAERPLERRVLGQRFAGEERVAPARCAS